MKPGPETARDVARGFYLVGLMWGAGVGAVAGGVGALLFYLWASSQSLFS